MASIWVESLGRNLEDALDLLAAAVRDCTGDLWETSMWRVPAPMPGGEIAAAGTAVRSDVRQRHATPWAVAWHALECFDYDLTGEFGPWSPPPPFAGHAHWRDLTTLPAPWPKPEILAYVEYCRQRLHGTLDGMTDARAAAPLPPAHRYSGEPHARVIMALLGHTTEHAAQIRQFITAAAIAPGPRES